MARISIFGGTGFAGSNIAREAVRRGHEVTSYSRHLPEQEVEGVRYVAGSVLEDVVRSQALAGVDVVVVALAPRGDMADEMRPAVATLGGDAARAGVRLGVVGGAGSLYVTEGGPRLVDTPGFPAEYKPEVLTMAAILDDLKATPEALDWFFVSPGVGFGAQAPGEPTGAYRIGDDVLLTDADGNSGISGADFALAFVDEIETPAHHRARFTVAA